MALVDPLNDIARNAVDCRPSVNERKRWLVGGCLALLAALAGLQTTLAPAAQNADERAAIRVFAEQQVMVLPTDAQTLWTGSTSRHGHRRPAPEWATNLADLRDYGSKPIYPAPVWSPYLAERSADDAAQVAMGPGFDALFSAPLPRPRRHAGYLPLPVPTVRLDIDTAEIPKTERPSAEIPSAITATRGDGPQISLVLTAVGVNAPASKEALSRLPREVALAIAPIAKDPAAWARAAKLQGRTVLAELPLEPRHYPRIDPGPLTLLTAASEAENAARLSEILALVPQADGVATYLGGRFKTDTQATTQLIDTLKARGLMVFENGAAARSQLQQIAASHDVPSVGAAISLDREGRLQDIADGLQRLEAKARREGRAVGVAVALPGTVNALSEWISNAQRRGIRITALGS